MPRLSDSMEEGTILSGSSPTATTVARGDEIAEIETDKANMTYEADAAGVFHRVARRGRHAADRRGDRRSCCGRRGARPAAGVPTTPRADTACGRRDVRTSAAAPDARGPRRLPLDARPRGGGSEAGARVKASPVARRLARELGVDLAAARGQRARAGGS